MKGGRSVRQFHRLHSLIGQFVRAMDDFKFIIDEIGAGNALENLYCKDFLQRVFELHKGDDLPCLDIDNPHPAVAFDVLLGDGYATEHCGFPYLG